MPAERLLDVASKPRESRQNICAILEVAGRSSYSKLQFGVVPIVSIRELFNRALEAPPPEREELLAGLPAAIRSEVLSLLEAHESAGSFLASSDGPYEGKTLGP